MVRSMVKFAIRDAQKLSSSSQTWALPPSDELQLPCKLKMLPTPYKFVETVAFSVTRTLTVFLALSKRTQRDRGHLLVGRQKFESYAQGQGNMYDGAPVDGVRCSHSELSPPFCTRVEVS
jgi:hypothetical protein